VFNFISWIVDHRRTVVLLVGLITVGLLLPLRHMEVIVDTDQLLPQSPPM